MNPKLRNALAELVSLAAIIDAAIPDVAKSTHIPNWLGALLAGIVTVGNQFLKDSTPPPTPAAPTTS